MNLYESGFFLLPTVLQLYLQGKVPVYGEPVGHDHEPVLLFAEPQYAGGQRQGGYCFGLNACTVSCIVGADCGSIQHFK